MKIDIFLFFLNILSFNSYFMQYFYIHIIHEDEIVYDGQLDGTS